MLELNSFVNEYKSGSERMREWELLKLTKVNRRNYSMTNEEMIRQNERNHDTRKYNMVRSRGKCLYHD